MKKKPLVRGREVAPLREVLAYENEAVIHKFREKFNLSMQDARGVFEDTKRWLWLCADQRLKLMKTGDPESYPPLFVDRSIWILDEMWHTFILFTKDYIDFCEKYFVFYIQHQPSTYEEKKRRQESFSKDFDGELKSYMGEFKGQMGLVYDAFGAETVVRWYQEYREKFTSEKVYIPLSRGLLLQSRV